MVFAALGFSGTEIDCVARVTMAKGTDSDDFTSLSRVRAGLKREFVFAMKAQSEIVGGSLGRTRARKNMSRPPVLPAPPSKRSRKSCSGEATAGKHSEEGGDAASQEGSSGVVDRVSDDEQNQAGVSLLGQVEQEGVGSMPVCENGTKGDVVMEALINEESLNEVPLVGETRNGVAPEENGVVGSIPVLVIGDDKRKKVAVKRPLRRFTRSALKQKAEETAVVNDGEDASVVGVGIDDDSVQRETETAPLITAPTPGRAWRTAMKKFPSKLKDLLAAGIIEGLPVKYLRGVKARTPGEAGLRGVIRDSGVLCYCVSCNGNEVVTPTVFELHAGSANKRPPEYIYLESGNTLRDIMIACWISPLGALEEAIQEILGGFILKNSSVCFNCRAAKGSSRLLLCDSCMELKDSQPSPRQMIAPPQMTSPPQLTAPTQMTTPREVTAPPQMTSPLQMTASLQMTAPPQMTTPPQMIASPQIIVPAQMTTPTHMTVTSTKTVSLAGQPRSPEPVVAPKSSNNGMKRSTCRGKSQGRLTKKDLRLHKLVFEEDGLQDGTELAYYARGKRQLVGYKKGSGILCTCCNSEVSASQFEAHAGWASRRKPYLHIFTSDGVSLHDMSITLSKERRFSINDNDDLCSICEDTGDLLCCDGCPRAFHIDCVPLLSIPSDHWYCKYCQHHFQNDKDGEHFVNSRTQKSRRCVGKNVDADRGGCALCGHHDFSKSFGSRTVLICDQCEKEYHVGCLKEHNMQNLKELPEGNWFCGTNCNQVHSALVNLVANGENTLPDSLLSLVKKKHEEKGLDTGSGLDIKWRVLNWKLTASDDTRKLLSEAVSIFHERFDPIVDSNSGHDFIPTMLYGRNICGQDFSGMFCVVLTVNQVVVSAGMFRVFGLEVAELPLVATLTDCQGQGYFQCLFSCIEKLLASLNVRHLVLPSAEEAESIWTSKFGFTKLGQDEISNYKKSYHMMVFQGTSLLQKPVPAL